MVQEFRHRAWPDALRAFGLIGLLSVTPFPRSEAAARPSLPATGARAAQFVFVIDDSGSMGKAGHWGDAADPDRLALFAVQSLISMLDDADEVSLVRLNAAFADEPAPALEPLASNRKRILALLDLNGTLAEYSGERTPCRAALDEVRRLLREAYRPEVTQVVMFLTDGECTDSQQIDVEGLLSRIRTHAEGRFQFYLLRFHGRQTTQELKDLAVASGGQSIEVGAENPTALLKPFADALSRSQGHAAELLGSQSNEIRAYQGARRIRLLAIAPDEGSELSFRLLDHNGLPKDILRSMRSGSHRYPHRPQSRGYRFVAADYLPSGESLTVEVTGSEPWQLVALPEYRLAVDLVFQDGDCGSGAPRVRESIAVGHDLCVVVSLINENGELVSDDVSQEPLSAEVLYGGPNQRERWLTAPPTGEPGRFELAIKNLKEGFHTFQPRVVITTWPGDQVSVEGPRDHIQVFTPCVIEPDPPRLDLGELLPGQQARLDQLRFKGDCPPAYGRLDRTDVPDCVTFTYSFGGQPEGEGLEIRLGQPYSFTLETRKPDCELHDNKLISVREVLLLAFPERNDFPRVEIPLTFTLDNTVIEEEPLTFDLKAGQAMLRQAVLQPTHTAGEQSVQLTADLKLPENWPSDLELRFVADGDDIVSLHRGDGQALPDRTFSIAAGEPLRLRVQSHRCCKAGAFETHLTLRPVDAGRATVIPIQVQVTSNWWGCRGPWLLAVLIALLSFLLIMYAGGMFLHSRFLDADQLAARLVPLRWNDYGGVEPHLKSKAEVEDMVRRGLSLPHRIIAWLRANPLVFGLPKRSYDETVELYLVPRPDVGQSQVTVVPERDLYNRLLREPAEGAGKLYAGTWGGLSFFAVPGQRNRISGLVPEDLLDRTDREEKLFQLRRNHKLLDPIGEENKEPGRAAGWQVG